MKAVRLLHFSVVGYDRLGRKLGIGTRVAAKMLRERAQAASAGANAPNREGRAAQPASAQRTAATPQAVGTHARKTARNVGQGVAVGGRAFGQALRGNFLHAVRALWHQITGVFFGIFALFFAQNLWRVRAAWSGGPEHRHFVLYLAALLLFGYFSVAAFVTARRPSSHTASGGAKTTKEPNR
jgi:hypothetical protein